MPLTIKSGSTKIWCNKGGCTWHRRYYRVVGTDDKSIYFLRDSFHPLSTKTCWSVHHRLWWNNWSRRRNISRYSGPRRRTTPRLAVSKPNGPLQEPDLVTKSNNSLRLSGPNHKFLLLIRWFCILYLSTFLTYSLRRRGDLKPSISKPSSFSYQAWDRIRCFFFNFSQNVLLCSSAWIFV